MLKNDTSYMESNLDLAHENGKKYSSSIMIEKIPSSTHNSPRHKLFQTDSKKNNFFTSVQHRCSQMNDSINSARVQSHRVKTGNECSKQMDWGVHP